MTGIYFNAGYVDVWVDRYTGYIQVNGYSELSENGLPTQPLVTRSEVRGKIYHSLQDAIEEFVKRKEGK